MIAMFLLLITLVGLACFRHMYRTSRPWTRYPEEF